MDENHRRFHAGKYTEKADSMSWRLRDSYRKERDEKEVEARRGSRVHAPKEQHPDENYFPDRRTPKRKDM